VPRLVEVVRIQTKSDVDRSHRSTLGNAAVCRQYPRVRDQRSSTRWSSIPDQSHRTVKPEFPGLWSASAPTIFRTAVSAHCCARFTRASRRAHATGFAAVTSRTVSAHCRAGFTRAPRRAHASGFVAAASASMLRASLPGSISNTADAGAGVARCRAPIARCRAPIARCRAPIARCRASIARSSAGISPHPTTLPGACIARREVMAR
jgi:hypothetical protein